MASTTLITNIEELVGLHPTDAVLRGQQLASLPMLHKAYLVIENHEIVERIKSMPPESSFFRVGVTAIPILFLLPAVKRSL
jgi:hypothetical protein